MYAHHKPIKHGYYTGQGCWIKYILKCPALNKKKSTKSFYPSK